MNNGKDGFLGFFSGVTNLGDERVRRAVDKAGSASFIFVFYMLMAGGLTSLIMDRVVEWGLFFIIPLVAASIFYVVSLIVRGAYNAGGEVRPENAKKKRRLMLVCAASAPIFSAFQFFMKWRIAPQEVADSTVKYIVIAACGGLFFGLVLYWSMSAGYRYLGRFSQKRLDKKLEGEE